MQASPSFLRESSPFPGCGNRQTSCLDAALFYAVCKGLPVFPCAGKIPYRGTRGFKEATTDSAAICAWWDRWPQANVAIPTGQRSGWLVLDIDGRHGGFESLHLLEAMARHRAADLHRDYEPLPTTRTAKTGGGLHLIYAYPVGMEVKSTVELADLPGVDVRAKDAYIVVAPSVHPSGVRYEWLAEGEPAPLPQLLADMLFLFPQRKAEEARLYAQRRARQDECLPSLRRSSHDTRTNPDYWVAKAIEKAHIGTRHTYALFLACRLVEDVGLTRSQAEPYMRTYVSSVPAGEDAYALEDALRCLEWAFEHR